MNYFWSVKSISDNFSAWPYSCYFVIVRRWVRLLLRRWLSLLRDIVYSLVIVVIKIKFHILNWLLLSLSWSCVVIIEATEIKIKLRIIIWINSILAWLSRKINFLKGIYFGSISCPEINVLMRSWGWLNNLCCFVSILILILLIFILEMILLS